MVYEEVNGCFYLVFRVYKNLPLSIPFHMEYLHIRRQSRLHSMIINKPDSGRLCVEWSADINTIIQTSIKMLMWTPCQTKIEVSSPSNDAEGDSTRVRIVICKTEN